MGELAEAVRGHGMRFGLYYSGGLDSTFLECPMGSMGGVLAAIPRGDYPAYAEAQVRELIDRYRPSVLWNDIAWPAPGRELWPPARALLPGGARRGGQRPVDALVTAAVDRPARRRAAG